MTTELDLDYLESSVLDVILDNIETGKHKIYNYDDTIKLVLSDIRKKLNFKPSKPP